MVCPTTMRGSIKSLLATSTIGPLHGFDLLKSAPIPDSELLAHPSWQADPPPNLRVVPKIDTFCKFNEP
jgi:hypothetical protein